MTSEGHTHSHLYPVSPVEASSAHHVLLGGVLVALQDPDPVLAAQVFDLLHRLLSKFLHR